MDVDVVLAALSMVIANAISQLEGEDWSEVIALQAAAIREELEMELPN